MRRARFPVVGRFDLASRIEEGTVTIDRASGIFSVRAKRRRKVYDLPLSTVAELVVQRLVKAEVFRFRLERSAARRARKAR